MTQVPKAAGSAVGWPSPRVALGLVLVGLGVPRLVDAIEIAYGLDIKRDVGVLPWLVLTIVGLALLVRAMVKRDPTPGGLGLPLWLTATVLVFVLFGGAMLLVGGLLDQLRSGGSATLFLALRGLVLLSAGCGALVVSVWRFRSGSGR